MFIQTEATRNPQTIKFLPGRQVLAKGILNMPDRQAAAQSPLALKLFDVDGVAALSFGPDYIAVTKGSVEWRHIKPMVLGVMIDHFMTNAPIVLDETPDNTDTYDGDPLTAAVRQALRLVIDPELGYNIVDLGLIYDVVIAGNGAARITMTTTTRGCPATDYLREGSNTAASSVPGIDSVDVELTYDPPWTPQMMSVDAKIHFGITD